MWSGVVRCGQVGLVKGMHFSQGKNALLLDIIIHGNARERHLSQQVLIFFQPPCLKDAIFVAKQTATLTTSS